MTRETNINNIKVFTTRFIGNSRSLKLNMQAGNRHEAESRIMALGRKTGGGLRETTLRIEVTQVHGPVNMMAAYN